MKKILFFAIIAIGMMLLACTKDDDPVVTIPPDDTGQVVKKKIVFIDVFNFTTDTAGLNVHVTGAQFSYQTPSAAIRIAQYGIGTHVIGGDTAQQIIKEHSINITPVLYGTMNGSEAQFFLEPETWFTSALQDTNYATWNVRCRIFGK